MAGSNGKKATTNPDPEPPWEELLAQGGGTATLSTGVVIKSKRIPNGILRRVATQTPTPTPPIVDVGGREEPNPNDPDYIEALSRAYMKRLRDMQKTVMALGVTVDSIPDGFPGPQDDWAHELLELGIEVAPVSEPVTRFYHWLTMKAVEDQTDEIKTYSVGQFLQGVMEVEVAEAAEFFRRLAGRGVNPGVPAPEAAEDGDRVQPDPAGDGVGV